MLIYKLAIGLLAIVCSAISYRMGGADKPYKSWMRDWVCPAFLLLAILPIWHPTSLLGWIMLLPFYGLSGAALSTYLDSIFGYDNYYAHGFLCGLAAFPLIVFIPWWILTLRLIICTLGMGWWSAKEDNDVKEEMGRGVFFIL
jgi:hypothetical protein